MSQVSPHNLSRLKTLSLSLTVVAAFSLLFIFRPLNVHAADPDLFVKLDLATVAKGYTAETADHALRVGIWANVFSDPVSLTLQHVPAFDRPLPEGARTASDEYVFDFLTLGEPKAITPTRPITIAVKYQGDNTWRKVVKYYDDIKKTWVTLPSQTDFTGGYVRASTSLTFLRLAVFEEDVLQEGRASYYTHPNYKNKFIAASRDYVTGTKLRIENLENGTSTVVTVVDYGPNKAKFPDRIVDISKPAFAALAPLSRGTIPVRVTVAQPAVLGASITVKAAPKVSAKAAIAVDTSTGNVLFSKNETTPLPIASLTKVMTSMVFLETGTPWNRVVTYQASDNAIGAKLYISPGEKLTVKDLFNSGLIGSANNAMNALARSTGLSRAQFVSRMNDKAKTLGLANTHFVDVTGLDPANVSTTADYAKLATYAFQHFLEFKTTVRSSYTFTTINTGHTHTIKNQNKMISSAWVVTDTKTGYLDEALYNLTVRAKKNASSSPEILTVVLGSPTDASRYQDTDNIITYALQ